MKKSEAESYVTDVNTKIEALLGISDADNITTSQIEALSAENKKLLNQLLTLKSDLQTYLVQAYFCTSEPAVVAGDPVHYYYGGNYYEAGHNYRGLEAWSSMSAADRAKFDFNYDALDLLIDPLYSKNSAGEIVHPEGQKYQYDSAAGTSAAAEANKAHYSLETAVDYTAEYNSTSPSSTLTNTVTVKRNGASITTNVLQKGDELNRDEFEDKLVNEQRHYSTIAVKDAGTYYVVNTPFQIGSTPYAIGETISSETYTSLTTTEQGYVTPLTFGESDKNTNFYYCREAYTITTENKVKSIKGTNTNEYAKDATVPIGAIISAENATIDEVAYTGYTKLTNEQKNFTIHGISPTETSTLYVSRESDIYDLSKEKIITVIYQYDYDETDASGNVTPVSERHVVNIHLTFKSGVPVVEDITPPEIVLPGDFITMREPDVTPGAYEVTGGGWELFATQRDAESHTNGVDYNPNFDKLYWYQDEYYVAYYAKSYLGRTYSNAVPVSVANYHDMADVMSDEYKSHHMYIDHKNVKRDPKIYINDYSASGKNGLDLFKNLYDLSLLSTPAASGDLEGHAVLDERVRAGQNLEFFLRTDIEHSDDPETPNEWTPIASGSDPCFSGILHGDGHTISGLDNSLFGKLCGSVYNLGVTGSFTSAGVADEGDGYVESCWINTTATPDASKRAIFGNPSAGSGYKQIVNSYYQEGKGYSTTDVGSHGLATPMSEDAFYNGTVAYDLNNFYLYKRYSDKRVNSGLAYQYWKFGETELQTGYYASNADLCSSGYNGIKYVEDRFMDGDFRYAAGEIPEAEDERHWQETISGSGETAVKEDRWSPIWPDDYIFFGQKLTYGWASVAHQDVPTAVARDGGRLSSNDDANRVYRAPAYFRSKEMGVAHFNPAAYLAQNSFDGTKEAYPGMTAIDFNGHQQGHAKSAYKLGMKDGWFFSPLLDDDGLISIQNCDETQNLLVYAPAASGASGYVNAQTHGVLTSYFVDPAYVSHYDNSDGYRLVSENTDNINGHLVQSDLIATNDHLLVDKQDFNAPLAYTFDADHLMWYQRKPGLKEYVDLKTGWQGISLPFIAELVTTDTKGEITHFYGGSETSKNGTGTKIGHEYWLRELTNNGTMTKKSPGILETNFHYPLAGGSAKVVGNTFLWDYYYKNSPLHDQKDANADTYLQYQQYYKTARNYSGYPFLTAGIPYILGLPGDTYYEFDLSGKFEAKHTAVSVPKLSKQVITFASNKAAAIGVSDDEMADATVKYNDTEYTFRPSYMNMGLKTGMEGKDYYTLKPDYDNNGDGVADYSAFEKVKESDDVVMVNAFRPYFSTPTPSPSRMSTARAIVFGGDYDGLIDEPLSVIDGTLEIYSKDHKIIATSHLKEPVTIWIMNVGGITLANYVLQPGETQETRVQNTGVYIVNKKKLLVK